ncbi:MAG: hypothetical protein ACP5IT_12055 [Thermoproteota archaeon]
MKTYTKGGKRKVKGQLLKVRIDEDLYRDLKSMAEAKTEGNISMLVRKAIREFIQHNSEEQTTASVAS